jgi:hypothetical protein
LRRLELRLCTIRLGSCSIPNCTSRTTKLDSRLSFSDCLQMISRLHRLSCADNVLEATSDDCCQRGQSWKAQLASSVRGAEESLGGAFPHQVDAYPLACSWIMVLRWRTIDCVDVMVDGRIKI